MKKLHLLLLSALSGLLLWLAWPVKGFSFLLLIAFIPLLFVENELYKTRTSHKSVAILPYTYLSFLIWNALTTWWIYYSTFFGAVMAVVFNSLFMALVFWLFHITRRMLYKGNFADKNYGYLSLIVFWISFEYFHLNWDLSWSWLNLGNGFSEYYKLIQWYEFTGTLGGSFWILLSNIMLFIVIKNFFTDDKKRKLHPVFSITTASVIVIPIIFSLLIYYNYKETEKPVEVVVIQPNIDPYNEKFSGMTTEEQTEKMLQLALKKTSKNTRFIVAPETALPEGVWLDELNYSPSVKKIRILLDSFPDACMLIGASTYQMYSEEEASATARQYPGLNSTYDVFNTALLIDTSQHIPFYHKSKLVPGVEKMPYPRLFGFLEKYAIDLGGMSGSHGVQEERTALARQNYLAIAPVICYESIYGDFVTGYIRNGAQLIFIITNDGWWSNTPGHRHHNSYARLRSIETRRSIARSANTGISSFINQKGDMFFPTKWWTEDVIVSDLNANDEITLYVKYGDYIGRFMGFLSILIILYTFVNAFTLKKSYKKL